MAAERELGAAAGECPRRLAAAALPAGYLDHPGLPEPRKAQVGAARYIGGGWDWRGRWVRPGNVTGGSVRASHPQAQVGAAEGGVDLAGEHCKGARK